ncbi:uncharacterized protein FIBRA_07832 [Fibroporia radiculosa]|uniref:Stealth protein CR3 conserved region 3 domain-containing protein n=1 Tax=Fibroporia radiculosa TaxID=599839 RepID=J4H4U6_9APHY|nr:uncharacterized protein FIBRA_07832 [Fibroporia radiculosa]CCM05604.1 predicted protein [Fibroporia radiculosa]
MRIRSSNYIPLVQYPFTSPRNAVTELTTTFCLRRRVLYAALFTTSVFTLFYLLKYSFRDIDGDLEDLELIFPIDAIPSLPTSYLPFRVPSPPPTSQSTLVKPVLDLPATCLDAYYVHGDACSSPLPPKLDLLWTWVNGSDPLEQQAKMDVQASYGPTNPWRPATSSTQARLYRDHDELRHSMRSVLANFRDYAGHFFLLTSDFPIPATTPNLAFSASWRLGQVPQWLDLSKQTTEGWLDGDVSLQLVHHAEIFRPYDRTNFNSLAIESQLGHVGAISDNFIYMNDDLYLARPMSPASFYTSAYGIVLHLQSDLLVSPVKPTARMQGEWRSMGESNYLLSERFGRRHRPYVVHEAKTVSSALLAEVEQMWPDAFSRAASHAFRETAGPGSPGDINTLFLHTHFVVERAREALLWTWAVARVGGLNDEWREAEARRAWEELGGTWEVAEGKKRELNVQAGRRETLETERINATLIQSGVKDGLGKTTYVFSSMDGFAYATLGVIGQPKFPAFTPDIPERNLPRCFISYDECFAGHSKASDVFKNVAFGNPKCGDCVISALVRSSGPLGLSAFLPPPDRMLSSIAGKVPFLSTPGEIPHLPLAGKWEDGDFSLRAVMSAARFQMVRTWALQLLQRYRYVIGTTPSMFERLTSPKQAWSVLNRIEKNKDAAFLCINDDVVNGDAEVATAFRTWQGQRWRVPATWEKPTELEPVPPPPEAPPQPPTQPSSS